MPEQQVMSWQSPTDHPPSSVQEVRSWRPLATALALGLVGSFCLLAACVGYFGSIGALQARLRGDKVYLKSRQLLITVAPEGGTEHGSFEIINVSGEPLRILGATTTCDCTTLPERNIEIQPLTSHSIPVEVKTDADFEGQILVNVFLEIDKQSELVSLSVLIRNSGSRRLY
jgi:hypothetical protein